MLYSCLSVRRAGFQDTWASGSASADTYAWTDRTYPWTSLYDFTPEYTETGFQYHLITSVTDRINDYEIQFHQDTTVFVVCDTSTAIDNITGWETDCS